MEIFMYIVTRFDVDVEAPLPFFVWHVQLNVVLGVKKNYNILLCQPVHEEPHMKTTEDNIFKWFQWILWDYWLQGSKKYDAECRGAPPSSKKYWLGENKEETPQSRLRFSNSKRNSEGNAVFWLSCKQTFSQICDVASWENSLIFIENPELIFPTSTSTGISPHLSPHTGKSGKAF